MLPLPDPVFEIAAISLTVQRGIKRLGSVPIITLLINGMVTTGTRAVRATAHALRFCHAASISLTPACIANNHYSKMVRQYFCLTFEEQQQKKKTPNTSISALPREKHSELK